MQIFDSVTDYINSFPKDVQVILEQLRSEIKQIAPEAEETMSYKMPTFKLNGKYLVYFAAWKEHIALYPATGSMETSKEVAKYRTGKGTFQFKLSESMPWDIIRKIVKFRATENYGKTKN